MVLILTILIVISVYAEIPKLISYQGRLTNSITGEPVIDTCDFTFSIYDVETGGAALWSETQVVSTDSAGLYCVKLGSTTPFPTSLDFAEPYWLGILIDGTIELSPRYQLTSSPYAFHSITADLADTSQFADMSLNAEHALEADSADYADNAEYAIVSDTAYSVDWTNITTMPAGFADGIDNEGTGTTYYAGDGIDISSDTISIPEDGIEAVMLSNMGAADGQVMKWNSSSGYWEPQNDIGGGAGDGWGSQVVQSDATLDGSGTSTSTLKIAQQGATTGQILKWDGSTWSPADDSVGTGGSGGISGSGTINYVPKFTNLAGDQIGDSHISDNVSVDINTSVNISHTGQVGLQCDGTDGSWASIYVNAQSATADPGYGYLREGYLFGYTYLNSAHTWIVKNGGWGGSENHLAIDSTGNVGIGTIYPSFKLDVAGTLSTEGFQMSDGASSGYVLTSDGSGYGTWQPGGGGGAVSTTTRLSGDGSVGDPLDIAQQGATDGQVLKWSAVSSAWEPANDIGGGAGDDWGSQVVQSNATLSGDGSTGNELQIAQQGAIDGQVLKWNAIGSTWEPANDETGSGSGADSDWTISGSDMYSAVSGNVGIGTTTPTAKLHIEGGSSNGIEVDSPAEYGIYIHDTGYNGLSIYSAGMDGIKINDPTYDAIDIDNAGECGIEIDSAYYYGLMIRSTAMDGIRIQNVHSNAIYISGPDEDGIYISDASRSVYVFSADTGIVMRHVGYHGIYIDSVGYDGYGDGIRINKPKDDGIEITQPNYGVYVTQPIQDGFYVSNSGDDGLYVFNSGDDGVYVSNPGGDGMEINGGVSTERGLYIYDGSGTGDPDTGIVIRDVGSYGIFIDSPLDDGINIAWPTGDGIEIRGGGDTEYGIVIHDNFGVGDPDRGILIEDVAECGILINSPGTHGMIINNADSHGVQISHPEESGIEVLYAGYAGAFIRYPTYKGVVVLYPGVDCYGCTSSRYRRFRVNSECEVFGRSYNQYIIDEEGLGIATPVSASTERWLEHIGESQLSGGECRVDLPQDFREGVTITKDFPMQVFVTPYGDLGRYTIERHTTYFIVRQIEGDPDASFAYKVHAKVRGGENDAILHVDLKAEQEEEERLMGER